LLATRTSVGGLMFVGTDAQGTLTATLTPGGLSTRQRYKPFGEQRGIPNALPSERGFIGQVEDTATGLSYLNARHYDARNATFLGVDPVLRLYSPESLNAYIYARNSPIVFSDPSGLEPGGVCSGSSVTACNKIKDNLHQKFIAGYVNFGFTLGEKRQNYWREAELAYGWLTGRDLNKDNAKSFSIAEAFAPVASDVTDVMDCSKGSKAGCAAIFIPFVSGKVAVNVIGEVLKKVPNSGSNLFPSDPADLTKQIGQPTRVGSTPDGTVRITWEPNSNTRIRYESHPGGLQPGDPGFNPNHHGPHYHVEVKPDGLSWTQANRQGVIVKSTPPGYTPGSGRSFVPAQKFPGA
jgi:RHS repeat-associated protein